MLGALPSLLLLICLVDAARRPQPESNISVDRRNTQSTRILQFLIILGTGHFSNLISLFTCHI